MQVERPRGLWQALQNFDVEKPLTTHFLQDRPIVPVMDSAP